VLTKFIQLMGLIGVINVTLTLTGCIEKATSCSEIVDVHYCDTCQTSFKQIFNYERQIGSIPIDLKMNEEERFIYIARVWHRGGGEYPVYMFIRPKNHPFLKEVVAYFTWGFKESVTKYYYREDVLDSLLPPETLKQYDNDTFNLQDFLCFKERLLFTNDDYYKVGKKCYHQAQGKNIRCKREINKTYKMTESLGEKYDWLQKHTKYYQWHCCKGETYMAVIFGCNLYSRGRYTLRDGSVIDENEYLKGVRFPVVHEHYEVSIEDLAIYLSWNYYFEEEMDPWNESLKRR